MKRAVSFLDLKVQIRQIKNEILTRFNKIIDSAEFVSGHFVSEFESDFSNYLNVKHTLIVNSGTSALQLILRAYDIQREDEVLVPANTFIATAEAISMAGANPVFVDVDPDTHLISADEIGKALTPRTRAIIPVHLYGQCADMDPICEIASARNIYVIEDAAQAHGATYKGRHAGTLGDAAAFSFFPSKNLGSWGEGGAITTNDSDLYERTKLIRDHGSPRKYEHVVVGGNFRSNEFQGAVLGVKLKFLPDWNRKRAKNAASYVELLKENCRIRLPTVQPFNQSAWHLFVIRTTNRDVFRDYLANQGIETAVHYPVPLHLSGAYKHLGHKKGDFRVSEMLQSEIVSLPMYPELSEDDIRYVADTINSGSW